MDDEDAYPKGMGMASTGLRSLSGLEGRKPPYPLQNPRGLMRTIYGLKILALLGRREMMP